MTSERRVYTDDELRMAIVAVESKEMSVMGAIDAGAPASASG